IVFVADPGFESAAPGGVGYKEGGSSVPLMPSAQMPFAKIRGVISVGIEDIGDRRLSGGQRILVSRNALVSVAGGQERTSKGTAKREPRHSARQSHAIC